MAARKRVQAKSRSFVSVLNGSATEGGKGQPPRTSSDVISSSDLTTYLKLSVLILLVLGLVGFLLYPDILNVMKTVHENVGLSGQTKKQELRKEEIFVNQGDSIKPDDNLTPADDDYAAVVLDEEIDHENAEHFEQTKEQEFRKDEIFSRQKNSIEQEENLESFDKTDASVYDKTDEDLMEDEEAGKQMQTLVSTKRQNLKVESKRGETRRTDNLASQTEAVNKEQRTGEKQPKDKLSSADEYIKQGRSGKSQSDKTGKKTGPIILNAQNSHVVLDPTQIKIIGSVSDKKAEAKQNHQHKKQPGDSKTKANQNNNSKSTDNMKTEQKSKVNGDTKTQRKPTKTSDAEVTDNKKREQSKENADDALDQAKKFNSTFQRTFTPKKIFADGRRIPPIELLHQKKSNSSVKVFLFDDFLSKQECDGLIKAHDSHVKALSKPPILCFDSIATLRRHLDDVKQKIRVTPNDFTKGTKCVNASFSLQLQTWMNSNWSYSTAFYPGESTFSKVISYRIKEAMGLDPVSGGKFQITSYPEGKAYKEHTDCTLGGVDQRDRVVSVLMYLSDVEDGGETTFPRTGRSLPVLWIGHDLLLAQLGKGGTVLICMNRHILLKYMHAAGLHVMSFKYLGIWAKPRKGRALVWNNMSPNGVCEEHSKHVASVVKKGSKYVLIRWYYYKTFYSLGHRPPPPTLPEREPEQGMVSCDEYNSGSCRWYDEWSYDALLDYERSKRTLI